MKILVAGMGNVLRGDDGFGIRVIDELKQNHKFTDNVDLYEAGIGGISLVQELMSGYDALIVIDAVEKRTTPGTVFVLEPMDGKVEIENLELHQKMVDMHYADPSKVLLMAKAVNVCPPIVFIVGCQPEFVDEAEEGLRPSVEKAIPHAVKEVISLVEQLQNK
jgi:hydrogenase maturation protease